MVTDSLIRDTIYTFISQPLQRQGAVIVVGGTYHLREYNTTYPIYVGNLSNEIACAHFAGNGVSLQEAIGTGNDLWSFSRGGFTNTEELYFFNIATAIYTGVSVESISPYDVLQEFGTQASNLIIEQGIKLISTHIREWASVEEPEWQQLIMDFEVESQPDLALELWDRLSDELGEFLATMRDKAAPNLRDLISITVQWK
jgi:hypothetical protein